MKILWLIPVFSHHLINDNIDSSFLRSGWIWSLLEELKTTNLHEICIVCPDSKDAVYRNTKLTVFTLNTNEPSKGKWASILYSWSHDIKIVDEYEQKIQAIVKEFNPDIIHIHGSESYNIQVPRIINSCPSIVTLQGILTVYVTKYFEALGFYDYLKLFFNKKNIRGSGPLHYYIKMKKASIRESSLLKDIRYISGRTDWDKSFIDLINPNAKYFYCSEMIRTEFYNTRWNGTQNGIILATISYGLYKGLEILVAAFLLLREHKIMVSLRLIGDVVGSDLGKLVENKFINNPYYKEIQFLGPMDAKDIVTEMANANIFVLPAHIENSPNSLCEALLVGVPSISANVGGIKSILRDGIDGILYDSKDVFALAFAVKSLLADEQRQRYFSENARLTAHIRHNRKEILNTLMNIYQKVIEDFAADRDQLCKSSS